MSAGSFRPAIAASPAPICRCVSIKSRRYASTSRRNRVRAALRYRQARILARMKRRPIVRLASHAEVFVERHEFAEHRAEPRGAAQVVEIFTFRSGPAGEQDRGHMVVRDRIADPLRKLQPCFRPRPHPAAWPKVLRSKPPHWRPNSFSAGCSREAGRRRTPRAARRRIPDPSAPRAAAARNAASYWPKTSYSRSKCARAASLAMRELRQQRLRRLVLRRLAVVCCRRRSMPCRLRSPALSSASVAG